LGKTVVDLPPEDVVIKENQIIKIPPITGIVHTVARGETVYSIAKKYQVDAQNIANYPFNDFADLDSFTLLPGQTLIVPEGVMPVEKPVPSRRPVYGPIVAGTPGTGNFIWPSSGSISQSPVFYHMALDIANKSLPPVLAAEISAMMNGTGSTLNCRAISMVTEDIKRRTVMLSINIDKNPESNIKDQIEQNELAKYLQQEKNKFRITTFDVNDLISFYGKW